MGAVDCHGAHQRAAAWGEGDALLDHLADHAGREPREQRDALRERRLERDLAAHRALGDGGDAGLLADEIRELVEAFLADHGGIHVGEQQPLAPSGGRLHDDIDRHVPDDVAEALRGDAILASRRRNEGDVDRDAGREPMRHAAERVCGARCASPARSGRSRLAIRVAT